MAIDKYSFAQLVANYKGPEDADLIEARDFNGLANLLHEVTGDLWSGGTGRDEGGFGYGKIQIVDEVFSEEDIISAGVDKQEWKIFFETLAKVIIHQDIPTATLQEISNSIPETVDTADLIIAYDGESEDISLLSILDFIRQNRFNADPEQQIHTTGGQSCSSTRTLPWTETLVFEFEAQWENYDSARHFFNAGGRINFSMDWSEPTTPASPYYEGYEVDFYNAPGLIPGDAAMNQHWADLIADVSELSFGAQGFDSNPVGTSTGNGIYELNTVSAITLFDYKDRLYYFMEDDRFRITAKFKDENKDTIVFYVEFISEPEPTPVGGIINVDIDVSYSPGTTPVVQNTFGEGDSGIDITPDVPQFYVIRELDDSPIVVYPDLDVQLPDFYTDVKSSANLNTFLTVTGGSGNYAYQWRMVGRPSPSPEYEPILTNANGLYANMYFPDSPIAATDQEVEIEVMVTDMFAWQVVVERCTITVIDDSEPLQVSVADGTVGDNSSTYALGQLATVSGGSESYTYTWAIVGNAHGITINNPNILNASLTGISDVLSDTDITVQLTVYDAGAQSSMLDQGVVTITNEVNSPVFSIGSVSVQEPINSSSLDVVLTITASEPVVGRTINVQYQTQDMTAVSNPTGQSGAVKPLAVDDQGYVSIGYLDYGSVRAVFDTSFAKYINNAYDINSFNYQLLENILSFCQELSTATKVLLLGDRVSSGYDVKSTGSNGFATSMSMALSAFGYSHDTYYVDEVDANTIRNYGAIFYISTSYGSYPGQVSTTVATAIENAVRSNRVGLYVVTDHSTGGNNYTNGSTQGDTGYAAGANAIARRFFANFYGSVDRNAIATDYDNIRSTYGSHRLIDSPNYLTGSRMSYASEGIVTTDATYVGEADFTSKTGSINFAPGETSKQIVVTVLRDSLAEDSEQFMVSIINLDESMLATNHEGIITIDGTPLTDRDALMFETYNDAQSFMNTYSPPTPQEIFNTWTRISSTYYYPGGTGIPSSGTGYEASAFIYDSSTDSIRCTKNTVTDVGFISPDSLGSYALEVTLGSTNTDNDNAGVILAFENNGNNYVFFAYRSHSAQDPWFVSVVSPASGSIYSSINASKSVPDGQWYRTPNSYSENQTNWASAGPCRIRVEREGNVFKCWTTPFGNTGNPKSYSSSLIEVDVTTVADLSWVRNTDLPYGYMCYSQNDASWSDIELEGVLENDVIYITDTDQVYVYNYSTSIWELSNTRTIPGDLGTLMRITNPETGEVFIINASGTAYKSS